MKRAFLTRQRTIWFAAIASFLFGAAGCEEKVYQIEQWPREDKLWRRLTVSRHQQGDDGPKKDLNDDDKAELARIARLYGPSAPKRTAKHATFIGAFANALPQDVGGDGHYVHWDSPLGRVSIYVERFRGSDDPAETLAARRKAVDQLVDLVVGWFETEMRDNAEWPALRKFFDTTFRHDLQNLSFYGWLGHIAPETDPKKPSMEIPFRVTQYLVERHYASYDEAPALLRELGDLNHRNSGAAMMARTARLLLARAGAARDGRLARGLEFLKDPHVAWASWERYLRTTAYYRQERDEFRRRKAEEERTQVAQAAAVAALPGSRAPKPQQHSPIDNAEFERSLYIKFLDPFLKINLGNSSRVKVSLEAPREPFWTNGKWVPGKLRVEWSQPIAELGEPADAQTAEWPTLCFAAWDEPNDQTQKQWLGTVGITQDALFEYNLWYQGLTSPEKAEWDAFLPTLKGDAKLADRLEGFHFSDEPPGHKDMARIASDGANAVESVMQPHKPGAEQILINGVPLGGKRPEPKKEVDPRD